MKSNKSLSVEGRRKGIEREGGRKDRRGAEEILHKRVEWACDRRGHEKIFNVWTLLKRGQPSFKVELGPWEKICVIWARSALAQIPLDV